MLRHAIIISNPGEEGADDYCRGVQKDVDNYVSFLSSSYGGYWDRQDIELIPRPTVQELKDTIRQSNGCGYFLTIFSGHGYHSTVSDSTILTLRRGEDIDSNELRLTSAKQTIILDCCREKHNIHPNMLLLDSIEHMASAKFRPNPERCRRIYDQELEACSNEIVVLFASSTGQKAGDNDKKGGIYSYNLIKTSRDWTEDKYPSQGKYYSISVVEAHNNTIAPVKRMRGESQTPAIEKPRSGPYFPFCIVA